MTQFLNHQGGTAASAGFLRSDDHKLRHVSWQWNYTGGHVKVRPWEDGALWPRSRGIGSEMSMMLSEDANCVGRWDTIPEGGGHQSQRRLIGNTLDATGAPLGSVTLQGFRTSDDLYVGRVVSDSGGYYDLPTPFPGTAHYIVAYKSGSPDITGATVNTLTPT